jgi:hypothetical protein
LKDLHHEPNFTDWMRADICYHGACPDEQPFRHAATRARRRDRLRSEQCRADQLGSFTERAKWDAEQSRSRQSDGSPLRRSGRVDESPNAAQ